MTVGVGLRIAVRGAFDRNNLRCGGAEPAETNRGVGKGLRLLIRVRAFELEPQLIAHVLHRRTKRGTEPAWKGKGDGDFAWGRGRKRRAIMSRADRGILNVCRDLYCYLARSALGDEPNVIAPHF